MSHITNFVDGRPGDGGPEAVEARQRTILAILDYLDKPRTTVSYIATHGPWNQLTQTCLTCRCTEAAIHAHRSICLSEVRR